MIDDSPALERALERIGEVGPSPPYSGLIYNEAERTIDAPNHTIQTEDPYAPILTSINALLRSLKRSNLSTSKIQAKLRALPEPAGQFAKLNLMRNLGRKIDLDDEDWLDLELGEELRLALDNTRIWFRAKPGSVRAETLQQFAISVADIYELITGKPPGLSNDNYETGYLTPFEELWLASLRLVVPKAAYRRAREIYRSAARY